jgi:hypothetical protein
MEGEPFRRAAARLRPLWFIASAFEVNPLLVTGLERPRRLTAGAAVSETPVSLIED